MYEPYILNIRTIKAKFGMHQISFPIPLSENGQIFWEETFVTILTTIGNFVLFGCVQFLVAFTSKSRDEADFQKVYGVGQKSAPALTIFKLRPRFFSFWSRLRPFHKLALKRGHF